MTFVVLSSSRGTTLQAVLERIADGSLTAHCLGLVTDRADRGCIEKARNAKLPFKIVEPSDDREVFEENVSKAIASLGDPDLLALMGWMWILSPAFIRKWKMINVHPALLPKYGGKGMYGHHVHAAVLASGDRESGMTIHAVDGDVDTGKILLQKQCPVLAGDTEETLQAHVQELEKEWYPKALQMLEEGALKL